MNSDYQIPSTSNIINGEQDVQRLTSPTTTTDNNQIHYSNFGPMMMPWLTIDEYVDEDILPSVDEIQEQLSLVERMLIDEYVTEDDITYDTNETEELFPPDDEDMYTLTIGEYDILHRMDEIEEQLSLYDAFVGLSDHTQIIREEDDRLSEDTIIRYLKRRIHISSANQEAEICVICQAEYEEGDDIGTLRCGHGYHVDCVKKWLLEKDSCPLCKAAVLNI